MAFDIVTYILSKKYADKVISELPSGFSYKGPVNYKKDLDNLAAEAGDVYTVLYGGESGTTPLGKNFAYSPSGEWVELATLQGPAGKDGKDGVDGKDGKDGLTTSIEINGTVYTQVDGKILLPDYPDISEKADISYVDNKLNNKQDKLSVDTREDYTGITLNNGIIGVDHEIIATNEYVDTNITDTMNFIIQERDNEHAGRVAGDNLLQAAIDKKQDILVSGENIKTLNGQSLVGEGNINVRTYQPVPESWNIYGTMAELVSDIETDETAVPGMAYLETLGCSDLPVGLGTAECIISIISGDAHDKIILFSLNSADTAPYHWEYNSWEPGWRSWASLEELELKQDIIEDLDEIREGAALGATAIQEHQDISHLATKTELDEKQDLLKVNEENATAELSSLTINDVIYKIAGEAKIGKTFNTNVTVGNLPAGTAISSNMKIAELLYNILCGEAPTESFEIYYGSSYPAPTSISGLTKVEFDSPQTSYVQTIVSGNQQRYEDEDEPDYGTQYSIFAVPKGYIIDEWVATEFPAGKLSFTKVATADYNIFYLDSANYDLPDGTNYTIKISKEN